MQMQNRGAPPRDQVELTVMERNVISSLELHAGKELKQVGQEIGLPVSEVASIIESLEGRKLIEEVPIINLFRMGLNDYTLYFSLPAEHNDSFEKLLDMLSASNRTSWLAEFDGLYRYGVSVRAKNVREVRDFFANSLIGLHEIIESKIFATRTTFSFFGHSSTIPKKVNRVPIHLGVDPGTYTLTDPQAFILELIIGERTLDANKLAELSGIDEEEVKQAISELRNEMILLGSTLELDTGGLKMDQYKLLLNLKGFDPKPTNQVAVFAENHPSIFYMSSNLGAWDIELGVDVSDTLTLNQIKSDLHKELGSTLQEIVTLRINSYLKRTANTF